jgi:hypothetical protein
MGLEISKNPPTLNPVQDPVNKSSSTDRIYSVLGAIFPNCGDALRLVELGQERPLKLHERFVLAYNSPLCLHCNCKREKFDKEREKYRTAEATRKG